MPCPALPCPALTCAALPFPAFPCPALTSALVTAGGDAAASSRLGRDEHHLGWPESLVLH